MKKRMKQSASIAFGGMLAFTHSACKSSPDAAAIQPEKLDWSNATDTDATGRVYNQYQDSARLIGAWAPPPASAWKPYFKPTLLASVDEMWVKASGGETQNAARAVFSSAAQSAQNTAANFAQSPIPERTAIFLDLPNEEAIVWGTKLAETRGFQPVLTYNNYPHINAVLPAHRTLGLAIYYASEIEDLKAQGRIASNAPPVFLLDNQRLSLDKDVDADSELYDNRYYLNTSDLPNAEQLKNAGIDHIAYVTPFGARPVEEVKEQDDLNDYFAGLTSAGLDFAIVSAEAFAQPAPPTGQGQPPPDFAGSGGSFDEPTNNNGNNTHASGGFHSSPWLWYWLGTRAAFGNNYYGNRRGGYYGAAPYRPQPRSTFFSGGVPTGRAGSLARSPGGGTRAFERSTNAPSFKGVAGGFGGSRGFFSGGGGSS